MSNDHTLCRKFGRAATGHYKIGDRLVNCGRGVEETLLHAQRSSSDAYHRSTVSCELYFVNSAQALLFQTRKKFVRRTQFARFEDYRQLIAMVEVRPHAAD